MKFFFHTLAFILLLSNVAYFQTPTPTAKTVKDDDIVKISTSLIQIDVTATDNRGKIVADLNKQDFEIYENGEKQDVTSFSFISANSGRIRKTRSKTSKSEIAPPPSVVKADRNTVRRTIALVVDDLTLSFQSVYYVRRALRKFVNEQMKEGDLVAIIRTGGGIGALQQFTYSRKQLLAAAKNIRWNPRGSGGIGAFAPIAATPLEQERANGAVITDEEIEEERGRLRENDQIRDDIFATGTMGAVNYIVRGMKELPGRKSIILLSDGFQLFSVDRAGFASSNRTLDAARRLVDLANRASVVIYSVDSRGLQTTGITAADSVGSLSPAAARQRAGERNARLLDTQGGLKYLSEETGGFAVVNNNDISGGVERILDDQSYYLIGYEPDSETFDPEKRKFNKLEVKVKRRGVKVRYRSGFFGVSDKQPKLATSNLTPKQLILNAISSPFAVNDIKLRLNTLFKGNESNKIALSSFVHIDTNDLQLADGPDGKKQISFDILAMNFGKNGTPLDQIGKTYTISLSDKMVDEFKSEGFVYYFTFPIKTPGAYQMRVAIRDHATNKVGSASLFVEAPDLKKNRLTLSGIAVQNLTFDQWKIFNETGKRPINADARMDTSLRRFRSGSVLLYGFDIYNTKISSDGKPRLKMQTRVFQNGKLLFEGEAKPIKVGSLKKDLAAVNGALNLGSEMALGDYILQVVIIDELAKKKRQIATQFIQFEIVE